LNSRLNRRGFLAIEVSSSWPESLPPEQTQDVVRIPGSTIDISGVEVLDPLGTQLTFVAPAGEEGTSATLVVRRDDGAEASLEGALTWGPPAALVDPASVDLALEGVNPDTVHADGGDLVVVSGAGFVPELSLQVGEEEVGGVQVLDREGTRLSFVAPPGSQGEQVDIGVTRPDEQSVRLEDALTYGPPKVPTPRALEAVAPNRGPTEGGVEVTLIGQGLREGMEVRIQGQPAEVIGVPSPRVMLVTVPPGRPGAADVVVVDPGGTELVLENGFTYVPDADPDPLALLRAVPGQGSTLGGEPVALLGTGFGPDLLVSFGALPAQRVDFMGPGLIVATTPPAPPGPVVVSVQAPGGERVVLEESFWFQEPFIIDPVDQVLSLADIFPDEVPASGGVWTALIGSGFGDGLRLAFGGAEATEVDVISSTTVLALAPAGEPGPVTVVATRPAFEPASLAGRLRYWDDSPTPLGLSSVTPAQGPASGGVPLVLVGSGFSADLQVRFGNSPAGNLQVVSPDVAHVLLPPGQPGLTDVTVSAPGLVPATVQEAFTYLDDRPPVLDVTSVTPAQGPASGGLEVVVLGEGFDDGLSVRFGRTLSADVTVLSATSARAVTPPGLPGSVDVIVDSPNQQPQTLPDGFTYVDDTPPSLAIHSITPARGPVGGGNSVTLAGVAFAQDAAVTFGGVPAPFVRWLSSGTLAATVPPGPLGMVDVTVENGDGGMAELPGGYAYLEEQVQVDPVLLRVAPNSGPAAGGTSVALQGEGLTGVQDVLIGGQPAVEVEAVGSTLVLCTTPPGAPGPVEVTLRLVDGVELTMPLGFFYFDPDSRVTPPALSSVFPAAGPLAGNTLMLLQGRYFADGARVAIGGQLAAHVRRVSATQITARTPAVDAEAVVDVVVFHPDGHSATLQGAFTYYRPGPDSPPAPRIDALQPATVSTLGGTEVVATGDGFLPGAMFFVDAIPAGDQRRSSAARFVFAAPPHPEGAVTVTAVNPDGKVHDLEGGLQYRPEPPALVRIVPQQGPAGGFSALMLHGSGFSPEAVVTVAGQPVLETQVLDAATILTMTPPGEVGPADVTVTNPSGLSDTLAGGFTYTEGAYPDPPPVLQAIAPPLGPVEGGTLALVTGQGLQPGARLLFGGRDALRVTVLDATRATVVVPPGPVGASDLVWLNPDGQASLLPQGFRYSDLPGVAPTIGGLTPNRGPEGGGTAVMVAGSDFTEGSLVFFDDQPAPNAVVLGPAFISTVAPPHPAGVTTVTVTGADGRSSSLPGGFTYVASPVVLGVQPGFGPVEGGTELQIGGRNFTGGATVLIGGVAAPDVTVLGANLITARTPPAIPGRVDVTVRNPDAQEHTQPEAFEYLNQPSLESIWPVSGPITGGTRAIIRGRGFRAGARVFLGGVEASEVTWVADDMVTAILAGGAPGVVELRLRNPDQQEAALPDAFTLVDPGQLGPAPGVASCFPGAGALAGGTSVRVQGSDFQPAGRAFFGGHPAATAYVDAQRLSAATPPYPEEADVRVEVTNPDGQSAGLDDCFRYTDVLGDEPAPLVTGVQPEQGPTAGGANIVVFGDHFQEGCLVLVGDRLATSTDRVGPTRLEVVTPPGMPGSVSVIVTNPDGKVGWLPDAYRYLAPPSVDSVLPAEGPSAGGTAIVVSGAGFVPGLQLRIAGILAEELQLVSGEELRAVTPPGAPGPAEVSVISPDGQVGSLPAGFVYTPPPVIERIEPTRGSTEGGLWVHLFGSGYRAGASVHFGNVASPTVQVLAPGELRAFTPEHPSGPVGVTVTNIDGFSDVLPGAFTFVPPPSLSSAAPNAGPSDGGTVVTVVGRFFDPACRLYFGNTEAADLHFENPTVLTAVAPEHAPGIVALRVVNPDGQQGLMPGAFTYFPPIPPPDLQTMAPNFGPLVGGTLATLTGSGFQVGARVWVGENEVRANEVTVQSGGQIRVRVPRGVEPATVAVRVLNPDGQEDTLDNPGFTYLPALALPPLALSAITPNRSGLEGGQPATILGNGFGADVIFSVRKGDGDWIPMPILRQFGATACQVQFPVVAEAGTYDLQAFLPSSGESVELADAVDYRPRNVLLVPRRGLLPQENRDHDSVATLFDADNDGFLDIFIRRGRYGSVLLHNRGAEDPGYFDDISEVALLDDPATDESYTKYDTAVGDFNQDGFPDLTVWTYWQTHHQRFRFRTYESEGHGTLRWGRSTASPTHQIRKLVVGDIDGRNGLDIYACGPAINVLIYNQGVERDEQGEVVRDENGRPNWLGFQAQPFEAVVHGVVETPSENSYDCDLGDVDHDGDLDIVVANGNNMANRLYISNLANGAGPEQMAFVDVSNSDQFRAAGDSRSVEFIDLDHDGHLDLVAANMSQDDYIMINDGAGNFANMTWRLCHDEGCHGADDELEPFISPSVEISGKVPGAPFLDMNQDGCVDLRIRFDGLTEQRIYLQQRIGDPPQGCTGQFWFQDHDGDGELDPLRQLYQGSNTLSGFRGLFDTGNLAWGDLDGDGWTDLIQIIASQQNRIYMRRPVEEDGHTYMRYLDKTSEFVPRDMHRTRRAVAVDVNGDGALDLLLANHWWDQHTEQRWLRNRLYLNDGTGHFFDETHRVPIDDNGTLEIHPADFNGDGHVDFMTLNSFWNGQARFPGEPRLYQNDGDGYFTDVTDGTAIESYGAHWYWPNGAAAEDFDGDGDPDFMIVNNYNHDPYRGSGRRLWVNGGDPLNQGSPYFFNRMANLPFEAGYTIAPVDFNGDGAMDVYLSFNGQNRLWRNNGEGVFESVTGIFMQAVNDNTQHVVADDFDGDGFDDLFCVNQGQKRLHLHQPDHTFSDVTDSNIRFNDDAHSRFGAAADFDLDGLPDVVMANIDRQRDRLYLNLGNGEFRDWTDISMPEMTPNSYCVVPGDFDLDGDVDVFVCDWGGQNRLLINRLDPPRPPVEEP